MKRLTMTLAVAGLFFSSLLSLQAQEKPSRKPKTTTKPVIEVAVLLDTSGSMSGLIDQAKTRLWDIVNQMAIARRDGQIPDLRVALFEYGKDSLTEKSGWIRKIVGLTGDLDKVSEELFKLNTNGGSEYCGMVIQRALDKLDWTDGHHYKTIFIAGNEPFTQGPTDYRTSTRNAIQQGVTVNTIHCGNKSKGRKGKWAHAASLADGRFLNIDHNKSLSSISAPQDQKIRKLNKKLNKTYVAYGARGKEKKRRQNELDKKAGASAKEAAVQRAIWKGNKQYKNSAWDLIDAIDDGKVKLSDLNDKQLPEELRGKSTKEQKAHLEKLKKERKQIQAELRELAKQRRAHVRKKRQEKAGKDTFSTAVQKVLKKQLKKKGFSVEPDEK